MQSCQLNEDLSEDRDGDQIWKINGNRGEKYFLNLKKKNKQTNNKQYVVKI